MAEEQLSKKELRAQKHAEKAERKAEEAKRVKKEAFTQNIMIWGFITILAAGLVLFVGNVLTKHPSNAVTQFDMPITPDEWIKGNPDAKVTVIEYADFQCPGCKGAAPVVDSLLEKYDKDIRFVYRNFPLSLHKNSVAAARAAEAAGEQEKFFEMHDMLFENQDTWAPLANPDDMFLGYAKDLGLDTKAFETAYKSDEVSKRVTVDKDSGTKFAVSGTPTFFVNGKLVPIINSFTPLVDDIEAAIKKAKGDSSETNTEESAPTPTETEPQNTESK